MARGIGMGLGLGLRKGVLGGDPIMGMPPIIHYTGAWYPNNYLDALAAPVVHGSAIATGLDKSPAAYNLTQPTGLNRPTWNAMGGPNGLGAVEFNGVNNEFNFPDLSGLTEGEMFMVCQNIDRAPDELTYAAYKFGAGTYGALLPYSDTFLFDDFGVAEQQGPINVSTLSDWQPYGWHCWNPSVDSAGNWTGRVNGEVWHSASGLTVNFSSAPRIGTSLFGGWFKGRMCAMIVANRKLTTDERLIVTSEIHRRTGILFS